MTPFKTYHLKRSPENVAGLLLAGDWVMQISIGYLILQI